MTKHIVTAELDYRYNSCRQIYEQFAFDNFDEAIREAESLCQSILDSMNCRPYRDYSIRVYIYKDVPVMDASVDRELAEELPLAAQDINDLDHYFNYSYEDEPSPSHWIWYDYDEMGHDLPAMTWNLKPTQYPQGG